MKIGIRSKIARDVYLAARNARRFALIEGGTTFGQCSEASQDICRMLGKKARFVEGHFITEHDKEPIVHHHCWVRIGKRILDVTADQFNNEMDDGITMAAIVFGTNKQLDNRYVPKI
jgi:hypothetical protein